LSAPPGDPRAETRLATAIASSADAQGDVHASNLGATSDAARANQQAGALLDDALRRAAADLEAVTSGSPWSDRLGDLHGLIRARFAIREHVPERDPHRAAVRVVGQRAAAEGLGSLYQCQRGVRDIEDYKGALHDSLSSGGSSRARKGGPATRRPFVARDRRSPTSGMAEIGLLQLAEP
jgi:hypothetical protein